MSLRDYQSRCVDAIFQDWQTHKSTLVVAATGTGKTRCFSEVIKRAQPRRAIVLAERRELIHQACAQIHRWTGLRCDVEMSDSYASINALWKPDVVVATIQTLRSGGQSKRLHRFDPKDFGVVIIDEAHHSASQSYRDAIKYFERNPEIRIAGFTATPDRRDQLALGEIFSSVAFRYEILEAVEEGWLVDVTQQFCRVKSLDFSHVHTVAGDLDRGELAKVMESEQNIQGVCHPSLEVLYGLKPHTLDEIAPPQWGEFLKDKKPRRAIMFTASVAQAETCCNIFNRVVPGISEWVHGGTPPEKRKAILRRFETGETAVVMNCAVLTEGFDNPAVEVIFMARPTKSRALYTQMVGRSTRPLPGIVDSWPTAIARRQAIACSPKPYCRVIDFVGNSGRHKLVTALDILGGKASEQAVARALSDAIREGKPVRVCRQITKAEVDLENEKREAAERRRRAEEARKRKLYAKSNFTNHSVNAFGGGESAPAQRWFNGVKGPALSDKQRKVLLKRGYNPDQFTYKQARAIIGKIAEKEGWSNRGQQNGNNKEVPTHSVREGSPPV